MSLPSGPLSLWERVRVRGCIYFAAPKDLQLLTPALSQREREEA
jgi:hypothetical protein